MQELETLLLFLCSVRILGLSNVSFDVVIFNSFKELSFRSLVYFLSQTYFFGFCFFYHQGNVLNQNFFYFYQRLYRYSRLGWLLAFLDLLSFDKSILLQVCNSTSISVLYSVCIGKGGDLRSMAYLRYPSRPSRILVVTVSHNNGVAKSWTTFSMAENYVHVQ